MVAVLEHLWYAMHKNGIVITTNIHEEMTNMLQAPKRYVMHAMLLILLPVFLLMTTITAYAIPANPFPSEVEQADGTIITIQGFGDEFFNWTEEADTGYVIAYNEESENWCYAYLSNNRITAGEDIVGSSISMFGPARPKIKSDALNDIRDKSVEETANQLFFQLNTDVISPPQLNEATYKVIPTNKYTQDMLVILIEYTDAPLVMGMDFWRNRHFGTTGKTVNDYYKDASGEKNFQFAPISFNVSNRTLTGISGVVEAELKDGVARVKLNKTHPGYSGDYTSIDGDIRAAFAAIGKYIDFSKYARVNSGYILREDFHVSVVAAGWEASNSANSSKPQKMWAHAYYYYFGTQNNPTYVSVNLTNPNSPALQSFASHGEIYEGAALNSSAKPMGLGVAVHEIGHDLGLPDFYDYGNDAGGLGPYSVMAYGSWGAANGEYGGETPTRFDPWSRIQLGFNTPETVSSTGYLNLNLNSADSSYNILKVYDPSKPTQYFLAENRQLVGYDEGLYRFGLGRSNNNGGVLIYHIDDAVNSAGGRINSNKNHKAVALEESDNGNVLNTSNGFWSLNSRNHFYSSAVSKFNATTAPNSKFHRSGHTASDGGSPSPYTSDPNCHPQDVLSGIQIQVNSASGSSMEVEAGVATVYAATINLYKDASLWANSGKSVGLQMNSGVPKIASQVGATGVFSANVQSGTWKILVDGVDIGKTIIINGNNNSTNIDFYTVQFAVDNAGTASESTISAVYDGTPIASGAVVVDDKQLIITATGAGSTAGYTYAWTGTGTGTSGQATPSITITNLKSPVDALCTITGNPNLNDAVTPTFTIDINGIDTYTQGTAATPLQVWADVSDGGTVSYQWYYNNANTYTGATEIQGQTQPSFTPPTETIGISYYYVTATNTNNEATGLKTATTTSGLKTVIVNDVNIVDAQAPTFTANLSGTDAYTKNDTAEALQVLATATDGGTVTYQWYSNTANTNTGGTEIFGQTAQAFTPPTSTVGTTYYYVVATNTNNHAIGLKTATTTNGVKTVIVNDVSIVDAQAPTFTANLSGTDTYTKNDTAEALQILATVTDGGTVTYQWYSNTANTNTGGTEIFGQTAQSFTPPTLIVGTTHYYVVATNTNNHAVGIKTATTTSGVKTVIVNDVSVVDAQAPTFTADLSGTDTYTKNDTAEALQILATVTDGGFVTYQWYSNTANTNTGGTEISGQTAQSFTPPTSIVGTTHYYVVATNTNNDAAGLKTATTTSGVKTVIVENENENEEEEEDDGDPEISIIKGDKPGTIKIQPMFVAAKDFTYAVTKLEPNNKKVSWKKFPKTGISSSILADAEMTVYFRTVSKTPEVKYSKKVKLNIISKPKSPSVRVTSVATGEIGFTNLTFGKSYMDEEFQLAKSVGDLDDNKWEKCPVNQDPALLKKPITKNNVEASVGDIVFIRTNSSRLPKSELAKTFVTYVSGVSPEVSVSFDDGTKTGQKLTFSLEGADYKTLQFATLKKGAVLSQIMDKKTKWTKVSKQIMDNVKMENDQTVYVRFAKKGKIPASQAKEISRP